MAAIITKNNQEIDKLTIHVDNLLQELEKKH